MIFFNKQSKSQLEPHTYVRAAELQKLHEIQKRMSISNAKAMHEQTFGNMSMGRTTSNFGEYQRNSGRIQASGGLTSNPFGPTTAGALSNKRPSSAWNRRSEGDPSEYLQSKITPPKSKDIELLPLITTICEYKVNVTLGMVPYMIHARFTSNGKSFMFSHLCEDDASFQSLKSLLGAEDTVTNEMGLELLIKDVRKDIILFLIEQAMAETGYNRHQKITVTKLHELYTHYEITMDDINKYVIGLKKQEDAKE